MQRIYEVAREAKKRDKHTLACYKMLSSRRKIQKNFRFHFDLNVILMFTCCKVTPVYQHATINKVICG